MGMNKGFIILSFILIIITIALIIVIVVSSFFLRIHLVEILEYEQRYNNAQLGLISLLSSTHENKKIIEIIAEYEAFGRYDNIEEILTNKISKFSNCYSLSIQDKTLAKSAECEPGMYVARVKIPLPNGEVKILRLVME